MLTGFLALFGPKNMPVNFKQNPSMFSNCFCLKFTGVLFRVRRAIKAATVWVITLTDCRFYRKCAPLHIFVTTMLPLIEAHLQKNLVHEAFFGFQEAGLKLDVTIRDGISVELQPISDIWLQPISNIRTSHLEYRISVHVKWKFIRYPIFSNLPISDIR